MVSWQMRLHPPPAAALRMLSEPLSSSCLQVRHAADERFKGGAAKGRERKTTSQLGAVAVNQAGAAPLGWKRWDLGKMPHLVAMVGTPTWWGSCWCPSRTALWVLPPITLASP